MERAAPRMRPLLGPEGLAALDALMRRRPLVAFDFDGTLAPIVARPECARVPPGVARRLAALAERLPLAVVSGRALADLRARLGFVPQYLVGNHGAEDEADRSAAEAHAARLDTLRRRLADHDAALAAAGVTVEDKGPSIALHYRRARNRAQAVACIGGLLRAHESGLRVFGGKQVVNVVPADAPDKAAAMLALVARSGCDAAFFAGDDVNDEAVFAAAPPHWLTVRVGRDEPRSRARFYVDGTGEVAVVLEHMQRALAAPPPPPGPPTASRRPADAVRSRPATSGAVRSRPRSGSS